MPSAPASPTPEIDNHTWLNCNMSDELTILHINPLTRFRNEVIKPWLATLDQEEAERKANLSSTEYLRFWSLSQTLEMRQVSIQNFCLSIDGMFERNLRAWLKHFLPRSTSQPSSAKALETLHRKIEKDDLDGLGKLLEKHANIGLQAFPAYPALNLMKTVANVCRHGQGRSVKDLEENYPYFLSLCLTPGARAKGAPVRYSDLIFPDTVMSEFCDAVDQFWKDLWFIFLKSAAIDRAREIADLQTTRWAYARKIAANPIFRRSGAPDGSSDPA